MRPMNQDEVTDMVSHLRKLEGGQLQRIVSFEDGLGLSIYIPGGTVWLTIDMKSGQPAVVLLDDPLPGFLKKRKSPTELFLRKHFEGRHLNKVKVIPELGRAVGFNFGEDFDMELILFPHGQNVIAKADGKSISWNKIRHKESEPRPEIKFANSRDYSEFIQEWKDQYLAKPKAKTPAVNKLDKLKVARSKVQENLQELKELKLDLIAKQVQEKGFASLSDSQKRNVELESRNDLEVAEWCFQANKKNKLKIEASVKRLKELDEQIENFDSSTLNKSGKTISKGLFEVSNAKGRSRELSKGVVIYVGKSGSDNIKLLKNAQAWDIWMHLKDYPSAHAIVRRPKGQEWSHELTQSAAAAFVELAKISAEPGDKINIIFCERRFVRAIKGDKAGRVTHSNTKSFLLRVR
jgi:predicted ribosome quality control (RQC) complex YloA/Tae2 family protein